MHFSYLLEKIQLAEISQTPFKHIHIQEFFSPSDFQQIIASKDIKIQPAINDKDLFERLFDAHYKIIEFPGCTINIKQYIKWHKRKEVSHQVNTSCEGFGTVLRLTEPQTDIIKELDLFLNSPEFIACIASKFDIDSKNCIYDAGIQKYLDGYEISPHPDIRRKALTYMVNINPDPNASDNFHHTAYLKFTKKFKFIENFWEGNPELDRCWVPWDWCEIVKTQTENNSIVIFSPSNNTLHAVKAKYDHLNYQRTQLYGNLWFKNVTIDHTPPWESLSYPVCHGYQNTKSVLERITDGIKYVVAGLTKAKITSRTHAPRKH